MMKKLMLDSVIAEQITMDPEFAEHYQRELLINNIAKMVVQLRSTAHLTQEQLANKAKTTQPVIARLESGGDTRIPSLELLSRIAAATDAKLYIGFDLPRKS